MPKENLNYDRVIEVTEGAPLPGELQFGKVNKVHTYHEQTPLVTLHWTSGQHAQLGIKLDRAAVERQLAEQQDGPVLEFFSETLERREMNDAVKALRRARDAVHGADA